MPCACSNPTGNDVYGIPVKIGEPLSTACERATMVGSIPQVTIYGGATFVNGALVSGVVSDGGIENLSEFFKARNGCYYSMTARPFGSTCV
jgi:hypothetical protein